MTRSSQAGSPYKLLGYIHHKRTPDWRLDIYQRNPRECRESIAGILYNIWLYEDNLRCFQERRIMTALLAIAQRAFKCNPQAKQICAVGRNIISLT